MKQYTRRSFKTFHRPDTDQHLLIFMEHTWDEYTIGIDGSTDIRNAKSKVLTEIGWEEFNPADQEILFKKAIPYISGLDSQIQMRINNQFVDFENRMKELINHNKAEEVTQ